MLENNSHEYSTSHTNGYMLLIYVADIVLPVKAAQVVWIFSLEMHLTDKTQWQKLPHYIHY